jgi:hypothetical protein
LMFPARTPLQFSQLQFHCGNPPPAPEPKICMRMATLFCLIVLGFACVAHTVGNDFSHDAVLGASIGCT